MTRRSAPLVFLATLTAGLLLTANSAKATHFRYGHLVWRTTSSNSGTNQYTAAFLLYNAFRRSGYSGSAPDGRPAIGNIITETVGGTSLIFGDGAATATLRYCVLNIDLVNDWLYAVAPAPGTNDPSVPLTHTYNGTGPWLAAIDSCCRISSLVNAPDGPYRVETTVAFSKTAVSPTSTLPIIVECPANQICNFPVPAADPENQVLQWRLATNAESAIAPLIGLSVNSANGLASYNTPNNVGGLYGAQIVIEKRNQTNPLDLLTKVGVDFLIRVVNAPPLGQPPSFGQQITIQPGQNLTFTVSARTNNTNGTVSLNVVGQPPGSTFTPPLPTSGSPAATSTFSFTPTAAQGGTYQMNFNAVDNGLQTTCGYSIVVPIPNTVVSLSGTRGGSLVRLQVKVAGTLCGSPTFNLFRRVGGAGAFSHIATSSNTLFQTSLTGPAGTLNEFYVQMVLSGNCAPPSQSNTLSFVF